MEVKDKRERCEGEGGGGLRKKEYVGVKRTS
jgi:hypothetical protein